MSDQQRPTTSGCPLSSDVRRRDRAESNNGAPITDYPEGHTPYVQYAQMDQLLALQQPTTSAPTEPAFIVISQVKELLFSLLHTDLSLAASQLGADAVNEALLTLRRTSRTQHSLLSLWDVLSTFTPTDFAEFRDVLGEASGFQSYSYRKLEFLLGNKSPDMIKPHSGSPAHREVLDQLHRPSLYDEALGVLTRNGLPVPTDVLNRDPAVPYPPDPRIVEAWRAVYQNRPAHHALYLLAEALVDTADLFARWRYTHLVVVQRLLGAKPGTGGTFGVAWLEEISQHRFFPELWSVRTAL